jgi:hypothetical protein
MMSRIEKDQLLGQIIFGPRALLHIFMHSCTISVGKVDRVQPLHPRRHLPILLDVHLNVLQSISSQSSRCIKLIRHMNWRSD